VKKITNFSSSTLVRCTLCGKPPRKILQTSKCSETTLHWPHFVAVS